MIDMYRTVVVSGLLLWTIAAAAQGEADRLRFREEAGRLMVRDEAGRLNLPEEMLSERDDSLTFDPSLSLKEVVDAAYESYPQEVLVAAQHGEAQAWRQRTDTLVAGYPQIYLQYIDDRYFGGPGEVAVQDGYQIPFWMWGQRDAGRAVAHKAEKSAGQYAQALKYEVAGLVRDALWNLALMQNRQELAKRVYEVSEQLVAAVRRRVDLGDLARSDLLLAESDLLDKKSLLALAEADVTYARGAYMKLTRLNRAPKTFEEVKSKMVEISERHPAVAAANAIIERAQADVNWQRHFKADINPTILVGTQHDRATRREGLNNEVNVVVQVPIGGDDYNAPYVAQANVVLNQRVADRGALMRRLEIALQKVKRTLEVDMATLEIANQRREIAQAHLKMSRLAFEAGEILLIDFLKIQSNAQAAIRDAQERAIVLQRDIALYNQIVGVMP